MAFEFKKLLQMGGESLGQNGVIGVDVGASSVKVVQLKIGRSGALLETYGELQLGPYANVDIGRAAPNIAPQKLTEAIVDIIREASVTSRNAALAIPYMASFVVVIDIATNDNAKLVSMVPVEARKYIPVPLSEVALDWFIVPETLGKAEQKEGEAAHTRVLLAAIHGETLKQYQTVVRNAGVVTSFAEIEAFSTIRSSVSEEDTTVMVIDYGAATAKSYIIDHGIIHDTHRTSGGAQDLTLALAQGMNVKIAEAEEIKRQFGLLPDAYDARIASSMQPLVERMLSEMKRVVDRYEGRYAPVSKVILSGGGSLLKGFPELAGSILGHSVEIANPFSKVEYPAFLEETLREAGPSFATAIGVALRRLSEK